MVCSDKNLFPLSVIERNKQCFLEFPYSLLLRFVLSPSTVSICYLKGLFASVPGNVHSAHPRYHP